MSWQPRWSCSLTPQHHLPLKVRSYFTAIALRCRTEHSYDVTVLKFNQFYLEMRWCCGDLRQRCNWYIGTATELQCSKNGPLGSARLWGKRFSKIFSDILSYLNSFAASPHIHPTNMCWQPMWPCSLTPRPLWHSRLRSWISCTSSPLYLNRTKKLSKS